MWRGKRFAAKTAGLKQYFTGVPCPQGHVANRHTGSGACVVCATRATRTAEKKRGNVVAIQLRERYLKETYGLSGKAFDELLASQGGVCAICESAKPNSKHNRFNVDHDHVTGRVRGILCGNCNRGLGAFKDSPAFLRVAAAYIENNKNEH